MNPLSANKLVGAVVLMDRNCLIYMPCNLYVAQYNYNNIVNNQCHADLKILYKVCSNDNCYNKPP